MSEPFTSSVPGESSTVLVCHFVALVQKAYQNESVGRLAANAAHSVSDLSRCGILQVAKAHKLCFLSLGLQSYCSMCSLMGVGPCRMARVVVKIIVLRSSAQLRRPGLLERQLKHGDAVML